MSEIKVTRGEQLLSNSPLFLLGKDKLLGSYCFQSQEADYKNWVDGGRELSILFEQVSNGSGLPNDDMLL